MRAIATAGLVLAMVMAAGCYSTTSLLGDTRTDTRIDPTDALTDTDVDPTTEPGPPDVGVDTMPACPEPNPAPDGPNPYFEIDGSSWPSGSGELMSHGIIESVAEGDDNSYTLFFRSMETGELHTLYVRADVPIWLYVIPGEPVDFYYRWDEGWWDTHRWFSLNYGWGGLIMAGGEGRELPIGPGDPPLDPLEVELVESVCALERDECGTFERTGILVQLYSESRVFFDRTHGSVGSMESAQVLVGPSFVYHDMECDDFPDRYVSGLILMVPEG